MLLGNYNGTPSIVTPLQGIKNKLDNHAAVSYEQGCDLVEENAVINNIPPEVFSITHNQVYIRNISGIQILQHSLFFHETNLLNHTNWFYGSRQPSFDGAADLQSIRWTGTLTPSETCM